MHLKISGHLALSERICTKSMNSLIPTEYQPYKRNQICIKGKLIHAKILSSQKAFYHCENMCFVKDTFHASVFHLHESKNQRYLHEVSLFV